MEVHFYKAGCADAARISFRSHGQPYQIFIDAGFERSYRQFLGDEIATIARRGEKINLWIISHIHDDHIGGSLSYIDAVNATLIPDIVQQWWYNPPRNSHAVNAVGFSQISSPASIRQGEQLTSYLSTQQSWDSLPVLSGIATYEIGELKLTTLSPGAKELNRLREKYASNRVPFEHLENEQLSEPKSPTVRDYHLTVEQLATSPQQEDKNIENGSSIALLTDYHGFKILWLADAHPSVIVASLKNLGYNAEKPLVCNWVKIAHHGSAGNNSVELYQMIQCSNYVISVTGDNQHGLPNKKALVNILKARKPPGLAPYCFYFTHDDEILRSIFSVDGDQVFDELNFKTIYLGNENSLKVVFQPI
jgi:beta-lactamase superfamily II metal-dependent hydrolase